MLPTFVIGLREGLEAALIVGIIAAFLRKQGRRDLLRWVFLGVGFAVVLCLAVGVALDLLSRNLPQRQQEGLETVIGAFAVAMVTYMVVWMKRHSRELKGQLEGLAAEAMSGRSRGGRAMVAMALLAVLREGFETVVFLLAAFNEPGSTTAAAVEALLGIAVAVGLGYGIYRGGVRINLSKFFRATGLVLVLVAAGLVVNALHTAHEAGWLDVGQGRTFDLSALVRPGSVQSSLLTGMLGVQPHPVTIELIGWLVYLIPAGLFVAWPPGRGLSRRTGRRTLFGVGVAAAVATVVLALVVPGRPGTHPITSFVQTTAQLSSRSDQAVAVRTAVLSPAADPGAAGTGVLRDLTLHPDGGDTVRQVPVRIYRATVPGHGADAQPAQLSYSELAARNGGRLPIGLIPATSTRPAAGTVAMHYASAAQLSVWIEPRTGRVLDLRWSEAVTGSAMSADGSPLPLSRPVAQASWRAPAAGVRDAAQQARADLHQLERRSATTSAAWDCGVAALLALLAAGALSASDRRAARSHVAAPLPMATADRT